MADLVESLKQKFFDANGLPLAGGKLYSYQAGTTTPLVTYANQDESTENTNPIILDANGEADVWVGPNAYKFRLEDADGNTLWTVDNVSHLSPDSISNLMLQDRSVTSVKIALSGVETENIDDAAVTTAKIANTSVTAAKLATDAVETAKIKDANVTLDKMATGSVNASKLTTDAVETAKIKDLNVTTGKLADGAVTGAKVADGAISTVKLAALNYISSAFPAGSAPNTSWVTAATIVFTPTVNPLNRPIYFSASNSLLGIATYIVTPAASANFTRIRIRRNAVTVVGIWELGGSADALRIPWSIVNAMWNSTETPGVALTYTLEVSVSGSTASTWIGSSFQVWQP